MRRAVVLLGFSSLGLVLLVASACKDHADPARVSAMTCERVYRICPNVVPASPTEAEECAVTFQSRCGAQMRQHVQCATGKCDDAGAVDRVQIERVCFATIEAFRECEESDGGIVGPDEGQLPPFSADAGFTPDAS